MSNNYQIYFNIVKEGDSKGEVSLKDAYCGTGNVGLPEVLVIPDKVDNTDVTSLAKSMFENNNRVKELTIPTTVQVIPYHFCANATNLRTVNGMEQITSIGEGAFGCTRIKKVLFPNLTILEAFAFTACGYLEIADIGTVLNIPQNAFANCTILREVRWKGNEVSIGASAFRNTRCLRELPLLDHVKMVDNGAFYGSNIRTSLQAGGLIGAKAFPTFDNKSDFWTGVTFTPCCNRIVTKLSQNNAEWAEDTFLLDGPGDTTSRQYKDACALFAVMHIHSAITEKYYSKPSDFVKELNDNGKSQFLIYDNWPGLFHNVAPMFEGLGYRTEVHGTSSDLSKFDYKALVDALAQGAYIYAQINGYGALMERNDLDAGHAVVIYGINDMGEVCVLDSNVLHEHFRKDGFEQGVDVYTYTIPYQNLVGPSSNFVIVYPPAFTADSLPSGVDNGVNVLEVSEASDWGQLPEQKEGYLTAYQLFSSPANAVEVWQPNESTNQYVRYAVDTENWSGWSTVDSTVINNNILSGTLPNGLPTGVNFSMISTATEWATLPEGKEGCLTAYHLFSSSANAIEEWQPNGSSYKYVRYAKTTEHWSEWYVVDPKRQTPPA